MCCLHQPAKGALHRSDDIERRWEKGINWEQPTSESSSCWFVTNAVVVDKDVKPNFVILSLAELRIRGQLVSRPENIIRFHRSKDGTDDVSHAILTMMNGDQLSYQLPLTVYEIKERLPRLPACTIYKVVHGTRVLENWYTLAGMDHRLSVIVVKASHRDWILDLLGH